jgi:hypothetical protein
MGPLPSVNARMRDMTNTYNCCIRIGSSTERQRLLDEPSINRVTQEVFERAVVVVDNDSGRVYLAEAKGLGDRVAMLRHGGRNARGYDEVFRRCTNGLCPRHDALRRAGKKKQSFMRGKDYLEAKQAALARKKEREHLHHTARDEDIQAPEYQEMWEITQV